MKSFSIGASLRRGWELFKGHAWMLVLSTLIFAVISSFNNFTDNVSRVGQQTSILLILLWLIIFALNTLVQIGWAKILLGVIDGAVVKVKDLFVYTNLFFKYLAAMIVFWLIFALPALLILLISVIAFPNPWFFIALLIVVTILILYFILTYQFAPLIVIDKDARVLDSFKTSARMARGVRLKLLGFFIVIGLINVLGVLLLLVGLLITLPVTMLAYLTVYRTLFAQQEGQVV